jgi:hypothetical protein
MQSTRYKFSGESQWFTAKFMLNPPNAWAIAAGDA